MERYGPQLPNLPQIPQIPLMPLAQDAQQQAQPNQAQQGGPWMPGATTIGIVFKDGVILAAEKRVTYGYFIMSRGGKKVFKVTDRIGVACAGLVGDMQILAREMEAQTNLYNMDVGRGISVRSASKLLANVLFNRRYSPLFAQTIVGGVDEEGPSIYILDVLGSLIPDKYAVVGSGTEIAMGVVEEGYKDDLTEEEAKALVKRAVKSAISRDSMSGDGLDLLIITKAGVTEESIKF
ncbi:MAG: archaeal proteasome endopeptidase complex subunit beta [Candidatus Bathyarchaeota archaeon]|nr:archaeal proteasome endopeptidase complex subunit beta [Candidatus Bathyarchaeota archaeon]